MLEVTCYASGSAGNCYVIGNGQTTIMVDPGLPIRKLQKLTGYLMPDAVLCTHEHMDHAKAVGDLMQRGIDCYMTKGTAEALGLSGHRCHIIKACGSATIGNIKVSAFDTQHDAAEPCGFLLQDDGDKLLYATDTYFIKYTFKGLTKIMVEANYAYPIVEYNLRQGLIPKALAKRLMSSHFAIENVLDFLKANDLSNVKEIWLIHLSAKNSDGQLFQDKVMGLTGIPTYIAKGDKTHEFKNHYYSREVQETNCQHFV